MKYQQMKYQLNQIKEPIDTQGKIMYMIVERLDKLITLLEPAITEPTVPVAVEPEIVTKPIEKKSRVKKVK